MATKKKKSESLVDTIGVPMKALSNQPSGGWPKISQGSHLTVITYEDGRTELKWDDEALQRDVNEAIASLSVTPTRKRKTKE